MPHLHDRRRYVTSTARHMKTAGGGSVTDSSRTSTERGGGRKTVHEQHHQVVKSGSGETVHRMSESTRTVPTPAGVAAGAATGAASAGTVVVEAPGQVISQHSHEGVLFWAFALLVFATWKGFWQPTIDSVWNGTAWNTPIDGKLILGGVVFAIVLAMMADTSDEAAGAITLMLIAMWLLFIMFNGQSTMQGFLGWFQSGAGNQQQQQSTQSKKQ